MTEIRRRTRPIDVDRPPVRRLGTAELTAAELTSIRGLMDAAFGSDEDEGFTDDDWTHALGGVHFVLEVGGRIVTHASVVERVLHVGDRPIRTGYVEAVATAPDAQGAGHGTLVMTEVTAHIREHFALGALGSGRHRFYERLGWRRWLGPAFVRAADGPRRTPDDEGFILILATPTSPPLDPTLPISCDPRPGDDW